MKYGIFAPANIRHKPRVLLQTLLTTGRKYAGSVGCFKEYRDCEVLILYGWGGADQQRAIKEHSGRYVAFDLGYWKRNGLRDRKWRVSIDGFHCPSLINGNADKSRLKLDGISAGTDCRNDGYILLIGNTPKSLSVIEPGWTTNALSEIRARFPGKPVIYRPKPSRPAEPGIMHDGISSGSIDDAIKKASLVVCRHSNVAVDCAINGVPVVCTDGAASSIYPNRLEDFQDQPTREERQKFLERLAWWQWSINEIREGNFWPWLESKL